MTGKITLLVALVIISLNQIYSQESVDSKKWKIGINLSPELGFRTLVIGDTSNYHLDDIKRDRDLREKCTSVLTAGIFTEYQINSLFSLKMGIHYSQRGYMSKQLGIGSGYQYVLGTSEEYYQYQFRYHYFGIPISTSLYLWNRPKIKVFVSLGCQFDFLYYFSYWLKVKKNNEKETKTYYDELITKKKEPYLTIFNPAMIASAGIDWKYSKHSTIRFEPIFRRSLRSLNEDPLFSYFYNVGMNVSYIYSFKSH